MPSSTSPWTGLACCAALGCALGCDVVKGFQDTGETLFPDESTHLQIPGTRIARGQYGDLRLVSGSEVYVIARGPNPGDPTLYSMRYADPRPCAISNVARFVPTQSPNRGPPWIAYFDEDVERGTLRFADADCKLHDLTIADARLPVSESASGFVVHAGDRLLLVEIPSARVEVLAEDVSEVIDDVFGSRAIAVLRSGRFRVFGQTWVEQGAYGSQVVSFVRTRDSLLFEDAAGIHRLSSPSRLGPVIEIILAPDGCALGSQDGVWASYYSICEERRLTVHHAPTRTQTEVAFDADPHHLRVVPSAFARGLDPAEDPFWYFFLRDAGDAGLGILFVRTPDGDEIEIGPRSALERLEVIEPPATAPSGAPPTAYGYALVDVDDATGRYVRWTPDGTVRELARDVLREGRPLIVDFDGAAGRLAAVSGDTLRILADGVPPVGALYPDPGAEFTVFFHDMVDSDGTLSVLDGLVVAQPNVAGGPPSQPSQALESEIVATNVRHLRTAVLSGILPGVSYIANYVSASRTGRLEYRNLELRFTAPISEGVADYLVGSDEILYSVPFGPAAGIWLVNGK